MPIDTFNPPKYIEVRIDDYEELYSHTAKLRSFMFRGHRNATWPLSSSFEREYNKYPKSQMIEGAEADAIKYFRQRAHLYNIKISNHENLPDLLSIMQHYGCKTRLLDFTTSFHVATYFAVREHANESSNQDYCIWAINFPVLRSKASELATRISHNNATGNEQLRHIVFQLLHSKPLGIIPIEPERISRRMSAQQGVLLAQTNIKHSFMTNLCALLQIPDSPTEINPHDFFEIQHNIVSSILIIKFIINEKFIQRVRKNLLDFNITSETLFPDLEGIAKHTLEHIFWQYRCHANTNYLHRDLNHLAYCGATLALLPPHLSARISSFIGFDA